MKTSTTAQGAELPQWNWTAALRGEFADSVLDLFAVCGIPFNVADNVEFEDFILRWIPGADIPDRRALAGSILTGAVQKIEEATTARVAGKFATGQSDGWRNIAKTDVITSMMSVDREVFPISTHNMKGKPKTGIEHYKIIEADMEKMRSAFHVHPIAWVTDDGPDGKCARRLLREKYAWLVTLVCWGHQSSLLAGDYLTFPLYSSTVNDALEVVRWFNNHSLALELFHQAQLWTNPERRSPLALILPALTRWTTHFQAASRLCALGPAMRACVMRNGDKLLEIGENSQTESSRATARNVIKTVENADFWKRLDRVEAHLKPIAIATNILQTPHTRLDHVLGTLANLYRIYDSDSVEEDGSGTEQAEFILATFFNPYIRGYCFNRESLSGADLFDMAIQAFKRFFGCDPDPDFTDALLAYSQGKEEFSDARMMLESHQKLAETRGTSPEVVQIWKLVDRSNDSYEICRGRNGIAKLAIRILSITANSADVERLFSLFGLIHTKRRNRLHTTTVHNTAVVRMSRLREHADAGRLPHRRLKRKL
ncbi:hypothetical protein K466DRAFT_507447, partial [Polyporus arcularius HHB13444]